MADEKGNLMETEEYERFRKAVQRRISSGELDAAEAKRILESHARASDKQEDPSE